MANKEEREDRETQRALREFDRSVKEMKRKEWEGWKDVFPDLYKEEVGKKSQAHIEIDKMQDRIGDLVYQNKLLKEEIRELKKLDKAKDKAFKDEVKKVMKSKNMQLSK